MNKEQLEILRVDFKNWLNHPLTDKFVEIITNHKDQLFKFATDMTFKSYYKKEISEQAVLAYGKADGIQEILGMLKNCKEDEKDETLKSLLTEIFGEEDDKA